MGLKETVQAYRDLSRKIIEEAHYDGTFTVTVYGKVKDETTGITSMNEQVTDIVNVPCHLSVKTQAPADQSVSAASVTKSVELITAPDVVIPPGAKITVTQSGVTEEYQCSGVPAVYDTHQEIQLTLFERWT